MHLLHRTASRFVLVLGIVSASGGAARAAEPEPDEARGKAGFARHGAAQSPLAKPTLEQPSTAPKPPETPAPRLEPAPISLRGFAGIGGGNLGLAVRLAGEFEYWVLPSLALGLMISGNEQAALLGDEYSNLLVGPVLAFRADPVSHSFFASAALGYVNGEYEPGSFLCGDCADPYAFSGPGASLSAGGFGVLGGVELGGALSVDLLFVDAGGSRLQHAILANFMLGFSAR